MRDVNFRLKGSSVDGIRTCERDFVGQCRPIPLKCEEHSDTVTYNARLARAKLLNFALSVFRNHAPQPCLVQKRHLALWKVRRESR